ncbi:rod shape-determining protein MreC [Patescibacteria group bacterium]
MKSPPKEIGIFIILAMISTFLLFSDQKGWFGSFRGKLRQPFLLIEERLYSLKLKVSGNYKTNFSSRQNQAEEMMRLQGQLRQLAFDQGQLLACQEENLKMRRLLGAPLPASWKFFPTKVIALSERMRINFGLEDQLEVGMMVISDNILIGRVAVVENKSALIELVTNPTVKIPVVVKKPWEGETELLQAQEGVQARGLLQTGPGDELEIKEILQSEDIQAGDLVLTSGEAGWLPDLLLGQVKEVKGVGAQVHKTALMTPLVDNQRLETVFVITDW